MPKPSARLIKSMAMAAYTAVQQHLFDTLEQRDVCKWEKLKEHERDAWIVVARACYAVVACNAGADVKTVKENPS